MYFSQQVEELMTKMSELESGINRHQFEASELKVTGLLVTSKLLLVILTVVAWLVSYILGMSPWNA